MTPAAEISFLLAYPLDSTVMAPIKYKNNKYSSNGQEHGPLGYLSVPPALDTFTLILDPKCPFYGKQRNASLTNMHMASTLS